MRLVLSTVMPLAILVAAAALAWWWRRWDGLALVALMFGVAVIVLRLGFWFVLRPFASLRIAPPQGRPLAAGRVRPGLESAYGLVAIVGLVGVAVGVWSLRGALLAWHIAVPLAAVTLGALLAVAGLGLGIWAVRTLGWRRLVCVPILFARGGAEPARLETSGPYALCRHPIYLAELVILVGIALASGVLAVGVLWLAAATTTAVVVAKEHQELRARFGPAYDAYAARVPALWLGRWPPWRSR